MLTVASLVSSLKDGVDKVDVTLEYGPYKKGQTTELGVRIRICPPGKHGKDCKYTSLHFHYANKQSSVKDAAPEISAHFKEGQSKTAQQGFELPVYDAYALYVLMCFLKPQKDKWTTFTFRVTKTQIENLIQQDNVRQLKMVFVSKVFDLAFWDQDAWSAFLDWLTSV
jgi:hypothetical protein